MGSYYTYNYTNENLSATINDSVSLLTASLVNDAVITADQAKIINERYAVVVASPSMWGKVIRKMIGGGDDAPVIKTVKIV